MPDTRSHIAPALTYPGWLIWYGPATGRWWALPPRHLPIQRLFEGASVDDLAGIIHAIETPVPGEGRDVPPARTPPAWPLPSPLPTGTRSSADSPG